MESAKEGLKKKTEGKLPAVIAAPPKSAAEMRRSLLEYVEGKIVGAADREGFQYQTMQPELADELLPKDCNLLMVKKHFCNRYKL